MNCPVKKDVFHGEGKDSLKVTAKWLLSLSHSAEACTGKRPGFVHPLPLISPGPVPSLSCMVIIEVIPTRLEPLMSNAIPRLSYARQCQIPHLEGLSLTILHMKGSHTYRRGLILPEAGESRQKLWYCRTAAGQALARPTGQTNYPSPDFRKIGF